MHSTLKTDFFRRKMGRLFNIEESLDSIFNMGYGSVKSPMDERVNVVTTAITEKDKEKILYQAGLAFILSALLQNTSMKKLLRLVDDI